MGMRVKVHDVISVVHNVSKEPWGYSIIYETDQEPGVKWCKVSLEGLQAAGGATIPYSAAQVNLTNVKDVDDESGNAPLLRELFMRRTTTRLGTLIPFEVVAAMCSLRYKKPYHVYRNRGGGDVRVVIAERGSGIVGFDYKLRREPKLLVRRKTGGLQPLTCPHAVAFKGLTEETGYRYEGPGTVMFEPFVHKLTQGEVEYMLNALVKLGEKQGGLR